MAPIASPAAQPLPVAVDLTAALDRGQAELRYWSERFRHQAEFARALAKRLPGESAGWPALIARAEGAVAAAVESAELARIRDGVLAAERELAEIAVHAKSFTVHCVGHAHIDMNWLWGWQETVAITVDTFATVLQLMDEFPQFTFSQSQASVYEIVRDYRPELLPRIRARIAEGRWEVVAAHWVEGDRNLAGGEALCRHLLHTRRFLEEQLGLAPEDVTVDWCPDTFGHAATVPSIDARGGVKHYYCCRTGSTARPPVFWWQGPDGARVLVNREQQWYGGDARIDSGQRCLAFFDQTGMREWMHVYGVGDHGGGPTRRDLRRIIDMDAWPVFPRWRFATAKQWFARLETRSDIPVVTGELNYEFTGCYTSQSAIKKANRVGEILASEADAYAALAGAACGRAHPTEQLARAWRDVLFSHFHDILPGSGIRETREYNQGQFQRVRAATGQIRTQSLRALAEAIDTSAGGRFAGATLARRPAEETRGVGAGVGRAAADVSLASWVGEGPRAAVVFNPLAWQRDELVRVTLWDGDTGGNGRPMAERTYVARSPDGSVQVAQRVAMDHFFGHPCVDLVFRAAVGGAGWSTVQLAEGAHPGDPADRAWAVREKEGGEGSHPAGALGLENALVRIALDRRTGGVASFVLKATGQELARADEPLAALEFVIEQPTGMSAWLLGDTRSRATCAVERSEVTHWGPHLAAIRVHLRVGEHSRFSVEYELHAGSAALGVNVDGTWLERGTPETGIPRLQLRCAFALEEATPRYEIPFGAIARSEPAGREVPALRWAALDGTNGGQPLTCALLNDGKHGHAVEGATMRVNIVRSSYDPDPLPESGRQQCRFRIAALPGPAHAAALTRQAAALNQPLAAITAAHHGGALPTAAEALSCDQPEVLVAQLKRAEDDDALVVRLVEMGGAERLAQVSVDRAVFGAVVSAVESDVLERPSAAGGAEATAGGFRVRLPAHGIATVRVAVKR